MGNDGDFSWNFLIKADSGGVVWTPLTQALQESTARAMPPPGQNSQAEAAAIPLPLFRPEALAAQESQHGEILLIRPLSLGFLIWLGIGVGAVLLTLLFFARIPDAAQASGVLLPAEAGSSASRGEAIFDVPSSLAPFVKTGTSLVIRCPGCADLGPKLTANVVRIEGSGSQTIRATVALPSEIISKLRKDAQRSVGVEAEVPTGRTSLIHWLLKPSPR
jgi:hypothetical protein